ncbi:MAG: ATP-binding protein [Ignavibacteria bacterium]
MWDNIIGQKRVITILKNIYKSGKVAQGYLFFGKEGIGKDAVAIEFAKMINCDNLDRENLEACDNCRSCKSIRKLSSTHFSFITALPPGKRETGEDTHPFSTLKDEDAKCYLAELEKKSLDPYYKINMPNANNIRIDSIRQIKREIYLTAQSNKKKVFLISDADKMTLESANSLLKILEEPPGNSLIILTTSRPNSLPPTIVGRCQKIQFDDISENDIEIYLKNKFPNINTEIVKVYAQIADGSIYKCTNIVESDFLETREMAIDYLVALVQRRYLRIGEIIEDISSRKEKIKQFLLILLYWFRDSMILENGYNERIINIDKLERLRNFVKKFDVKYFAATKAIEDMIYDVESYINGELLLYTLTTRLTDQIRIKSSGPST